MNDRPEFEAVFYGGPSDHEDGTVRRIPMVRGTGDREYDWVIPLEIETDQVCFDGTPPRRTGRYVRLMTNFNEARTVYRWEPESIRSAVPAAVELTPGAPKP